MLSKHPERCRFPHGHSRTIEVVVAASQLDANGMVVDFKALRLALSELVERFDHAMAVNSRDPLLPAIRDVYPESLIVFENEDPTTEVIAASLFRSAGEVLKSGWQSPDGRYAIKPGQVHLERIRVWETADSWAEVAERTDD